VIFLPRGIPGSAVRPRITGNPTGRPKVEFSREDLLRNYAEHQNWFIVAKKLGVSHVTIYRRIKEFRIEKVQFYR
jgi:transcriptional regulator of acetoin/glycerol metabolism